MSVNWNPWHGCQKISEGCFNCYVYRTDAKYERDSSEVKKNIDFNLPLKRNRNKEYKIPSGETVYTCFTSDFLLPEADEWRTEAWQMFRERADLTTIKNEKLYLIDRKYQHSQARKANINLGEGNIE